jgi:hypothetical protein
MHTACNHACLRWRLPARALLVCCAAMDANSQTYTQRMEALRAYMEHRSFPRHLKMRVMRYFKVGVASGARLQHAPSRRAVPRRNMSSLCCSAFRGLLQRAALRCQVYLRQKTAMDESSILVQLTNQLRQEVALYLVQRTMHGVGLFAEVKIESLIHLIVEMKPFALNRTLAAFDADRTVFVIIGTAAVLHLRS